MSATSFRDRSFWLSSRPYQPGPPLGGDLDVDVAIVGAGFTGLATAWFLKQEEPSLRVALLESEVVGFGASGRNGGFNMTLFGMTLAITAFRFGKARAREAHHYMERAVDLVRDLVRDLQLDCDYEHNGFLRVATSEPYKARILHEVELAGKLGLSGIEWIEKEALEREVRSRQYLGAWWEPRCGILNPAKLAWAWRDKVAAAGVQVLERTPVGEIAREGARVLLRTPGGTVRADKLVLATNAWSHLFAPIKRKQVPVWTHIVLTEPLREEHVREIGWRRRQGIEDARDLVHYYRLTADHRLLMGGRDVSLARGDSMENDVNEETFAGLRRDVVDLFPSLRDVKFTHQWGGPVSVPIDMAPALGYAGDKNVVYSLGCVGHGVSLTHLNGRTLADLVLERKTDLTSVFFVNRRTIPWPGGFINALLARGIRGYLRLEDRWYDPKPGTG
jgi:glycine/D-amino acid oxidase-like deaminating enzyme